MEITINIKKKNLKDMFGNPFTLLIYYSCCFQKNGKYPSMKQVSEELGISYNSIRMSLTKLLRILSSEEYDGTELGELGKSILQKTKGNHLTRTKAKPVSKYEAEWNEVLKQLPEKYLNKKFNYYYRTEMWMSNLFAMIKKEELPLYISWFMKNKISQIGEFNAGIFCCRPMVEEYNKNGRPSKESISRKRIEGKKSEFEKEASREEKKLLESILEKKSKGRLDEFELEALQYFQEKGLYDPVANIIIN